MQLNQSPPEMDQEEVSRESGLGSLCVSFLMRVYCDGKLQVAGCHFALLNYVTVFPLYRALQLLPR